MTGILYQNGKCFITLQEILTTKEKNKFRDKIKNQLPSFILPARFDQNIEEVLGHQLNIPTTPEEYESTKIKIGQVVKINMPTKIADIIMIEKTIEESEIKLE